MLLFYLTTLLIFPIIFGIRRANETTTTHPETNIVKVLISLLLFIFCIEYILEINNSDPQKIISAPYFVPLSIIFTASLTKVIKHIKITFDYYLGVNHWKIILLFTLILGEILIIHFGYWYLKPHLY